MSARSEDSEPLFGVSLASVRKVPFRDIALRFAFGAAISAIAGIVSIVFGSRVGGVFLAFPAILPATLTLIEKEDSTKDAEGDDVGAILGAAALILFAVIGWRFFPRLGGAVTLVIATVAWLAAAIALYLCLRLPWRRWSGKKQRG